jgi:hypothetical protein
MLRMMVVASSKKRQGVKASKEREREMTEVPSTEMARHTTAGRRARLADVGWVP